MSPTATVLSSGRSDRLTFPHRGASPMVKALVACAK